MGLGFKEVSEFKNCPYRLLENGNNVLFQTAMGDLSAVEISASILSTLKNRAEGALGGDLMGAVITVPAYFNDTQRQSTKDAAPLAGIKVLRETLEIYHIVGAIFIFTGIYMVNKERKYE